MSKLIFTLLFIVQTSLFANFLQLNDTVPTLKLEDQFEKIHTLEPNKIKTYIFSSQRDTSKWMDQFLQTKEKNFLQNNHTVYISDISGMPSFITSLFALPKMQKYPYTLFLLYDENTLFPTKEDTLSVLKVQNGVVKSIQYISNPEDIKNIF